MDPVVTSLLQTNHAASASDAAQVRQLSEDALALLAAVEDELSRLTEKRDALQNAIRCYAIALAPIRLLPIDILQHIFLFTLSEDRTPVMSPKESPLLVSQVCSTWRQAALSAPRLWSRLHIPLVGHAPSTSGFIFRLGHPDNLTSQLTESEADLCMQRRRQMVEQWLMRAGKTDLSISITDDARADIPSKENEPQHSVDIVEILVKYAGQLAVLDLGIAPRLAKPILGKKLTRLRDLRLCHREYYGSAQQNICTEHVIVSSPNIRSLRICISTPATNGMSVQWANLTNLALTLQHGSWIEDPDLLVEFIWGLQNLIVLSVVITAHRPIRSSTTLNNEVRRTLPRLKTLFWDNGGSGADDRLFERLVFPSLQELKWTVSDRFQSGGYGAPGFVKWDCPLTHLLERSGQNLKKLELGMLEEMPSLSNYSRLGFTPRIEMLHFELSSPVSASNIWRALSLPIPTPAHHRASAVRKPAPPPSAPISAQAPSVFQGGNVPVGSFPGGVQTWQSFGVQPFPKLAVLSCRCHTNDFAPDALQQFIRSRRDANILAKHGASKLQKISISLSNNHAPPYQLPYAISARENSEKKQREFMEELTTKFGAEVVGGLEMDIEWPNVYWTSSALLSPYSGLRFEDGQRYWTGGRPHQMVGLFPHNLLGLC